MKQDVLRQIAVIVTFISALVMNGLATGLPLNGMDTGTISDMFPNYFTPASYVFSIWGLIYLGLAAFAIYQALPAQREDARLQSIFVPFLVASAARAVVNFLRVFRGSMTSSM